MNAMKKRTNKILIIAIAVFLAVITVKFFINANSVKKEMKEKETNESIINQN
jgi:uncharacterized protein involved in outer membrane biogenesis